MPKASGSARMKARCLPVTAELATLDLNRGTSRVVDVDGGIGTVLAALLDDLPVLWAAETTSDKDPRT